MTYCLHFHTFASSKSPKSSSDTLDMSLKENLSKLIQFTAALESNCEALCNSTSRLQHSLQQADQTITTLTEANEKYVVVNSRITETRKELRKILEYTKVPELVETIIFMGLSTSQLLGRHIPNNVPEIKLSYLKPQVLDCSQLLKYYLIAFTLIVDAYQFFEQRSEMTISLPTLVKLKPLITVTLIIIHLLLSFYLVLFSMLLIERLQ